jgi:hypothetical protein
MLPSGGHDRQDKWKFRQKLDRVSRNRSPKACEMAPRQMEQVFLALASAMLIAAELAYERAKPVSDTNLL